MIYDNPLRFFNYLTLIHPKIKFIYFLIFIKTYNFMHITNKSIELLCKKKN